MDLLSQATMLSNSCSSCKTQMLENEQMKSLITNISAYKHISLKPPVSQGSINKIILITILLIYVQYIYNNCNDNELIIITIIIIM